MITDPKIQPAQQSDLPIIAAMHIEPDSTKVADIIQKHNGQYKFFLDKVRMFFGIEPSGVLLAKKDGRIAAVIIVSKNDSEVKKLSFKKGYFLAFVLNSLLLRYGLTKSMIKKLFLVPYANFIAQKVKPSIKTAKPIDAKIWVLIVMKETRRQGIGLELIQSACDYSRAQGAHTIGVTVVQNNTGALTVYQKAGFNIIGQVFESNGLSYYMAKSLD